MLVILIAIIIGTGIIFLSQFCEEYESKEKCQVVGSVIIILGIIGLFFCPTA